MAEGLLRPRFVGLALGLAMALGCLPAGLEAGMVRSRPSGAASLTPRQAREAQVRRLLGEAKVAQALAAVGLTPEQVRSRLDRLSDPQLDELAQHLETIQAGRIIFFVLLFVPLLLIISLIAGAVEAIID